MSTVTTLKLIKTINDITMLQAALTPLVANAMAAGRTEVTEEEISAARAKAVAGLDALDAAIEAARGNPQV